MLMIVKPSLECSKKVAHKRPLHELIELAGSTDRSHPAMNAATQNSETPNAYTRMHELLKSLVHVRMP
jgi:hypothetical protein